MMRASLTLRIAAATLLLATFPAAPNSAATQAAAPDSAVAAMTRSPFTWLPSTGLIPQSVRLARGLEGLRAALGTQASGDFFASILAARRSLAAIDSAGFPHVWVVADYAGGQEERTASDSLPPTTLVLLLDPLDARIVDPRIAFSQVLAAAQTPIEGAGSISEVEGGGGGWIVSGRTRSFCVARRGNDLVFCSSRLFFPVFRAWVRELLGPAGP